MSQPPHPYAPPIAPLAARRSTAPWAASPEDAGRVRRALWILFYVRMIQAAAIAVHWWSPLTLLDRAEWSDTLAWLQMGLSLLTSIPIAIAVASLRRSPPMRRPALLFLFVLAAEWIVRGGRAIAVDQLTSDAITATDHEALFTIVFASSLALLVCYIVRALSFVVLMARAGHAMTAPAPRLLLAVAAGLAVTHFLVSLSWTTLTVVNEGGWITDMVMAPMAPFIVQVLNFSVYAQSLATTAVIVVILWRSRHPMMKP